MKSNENKKIDRKIWSLILIITLCLFIPMIFTWIYGGELNFSRNNWLVAMNGKCWGLLKDGTYGYGVSRFVWCSWEPFIISFCILIFSLIVWMVLTYFKLSKINYFTYIFSTWFLLFIILITGLISYNQSWTIPVRIITIVISYFLVFIVINALFNRVIINTRFASIIANEIIKSEIECKKYLDDNKISPVDKKEKESVEIDDKEIK